CSREVRVHDYLLGRHNMRQYLLSELVLDSRNPLFANWSEEMKEDYAVDANGQRIAPGAGPYFLPVIPIAADLSVKTALPPWPKGKLVPTDFADPIKRRLEAILETLREDNLKGFWSWFGGELAIGPISNLVTNWIIQAWTKELQAADLLD